MDAIAEIKKLLDSEKLLIGSEQTLKELRTGSLSKVYMAQNPKPELKEDIERYAGIAQVEIVLLDVPNDELGTLCKKPFPISVLSVKA